MIISQDPDVLEIFIEISANTNLANIYMLTFKSNDVYALENVLHIAKYMLLSHRSKILLLSKGSELTKNPQKKKKEKKTRQKTQPEQSNLAKKPQTNKKNQKEKGCYTQRAPRGMEWEYCQNVDYRRKKGSRWDYYMTISESLKIAHRQFWKGHQPRECLVPLCRCW